MKRPLTIKWILLTIMTGTTAAAFIFAGLILALYYREWASGILSFFCGCVCFFAACAFFDEVKLLLSLWLLGRKLTADESRTVARCDGLTNCLLREAGAEAMSVPASMIHVIPPGCWREAGGDPRINGVYSGRHEVIILLDQLDPDIFQRVVMHEMMHAKSVRGSGLFQTWANEAMTELSVSAILRVFGNGPAGGPPSGRPASCEWSADGLALPTIRRDSDGGICVDIPAVAQPYAAECLRLLQTIERLSQVPGESRRPAARLLRRVWLTGDKDLAAELRRLIESAAEDGQGPIDIFC